MVIQKGVSVEELSKRYPVLYHMAEFDTWASIRKYGLLSTTALLDLFEIDGKERSTIEKKHRPASVEIANQGLGNALAEVAIQYSVPDIQKHVIAVDHMLSDQILESVYRA